jgi:hypothetical protein
MIMCEDLIKSSKSSSGRMQSQPPKSTMVGEGEAILYTLVKNYRHQIGATCLAPCLLHGCLPINRQRIQAL